MRFLSLMFLLVLCSWQIEALKKRQVNEVHDGRCPIHRMICHIYCPPNSAARICVNNANCCSNDSHCAVDEKCCRPACGCLNRCAKAEK